MTENLSYSEQLKHLQTIIHFARLREINNNGILLILGNPSAERVDEILNGPDFARLVNLVLEALGQERSYLADWAFPGITGQEVSANDSFN